MRIVHIGLGKTGTSAIQRWVFPELVSMDLVESYNPRNLLLPLHRNIVTGLTQAEKKEFKKAFTAHKSLLLSFESLVDWNNDNWQRARDENFEMFGAETTILITIRDPRSYLTSVYQQVVMEGHVIPPKEFFISQAQYDSIRQAERRGALDFLNQNSFDLEKLVELYSAKFKKVVVVALPKIAEMQFMHELFEMDEANREVLQDAFGKSSGDNRSYEQPP